MMINNQSEQDYLEALLLICKGQGFAHRIDVAKRLGVSQAAVNKAIKLLQEKGYVDEVGKHLYLSERGRAYAEEVFEKHCIIRDFLLSLGVSEEAAEEDACRIEHVISTETFEKIKDQIKKA